MTSLPSFRAMLEGDEHSTLQATAFTFPTSSAFLMSPHLTSFPPLVKQSLPQCSTFMNAPMFPIISGVQNGINSSHSHIQTGFFSEGDKKYCLPDRALQKRMDVATPTTKETFEINVPQDNEVMALSKSSQGTQQSQPQRSLLQEQQKEVRERMEYLSTLLNSASTPDGRTEVPRRSRELSVATDEDDVSPEGIFDHYIEQLPAKKRQRVDPSSKQAAEKRFRTYQAEQWNEKFDDLVRFKNKFRHCCVPHTYPEDPTLARWVKRQRYQYKLYMEGKSESTMTEERKNLLQDLGFVWDRHSEAWEMRFSELCDFFQENGHTNVPSNYRSTRLSTWVKCQRRQYKMHWDVDSANKKTLLSTVRIQRLEALGFEWELRSRSKTS